MSEGQTAAAIDAANRKKRAAQTGTAAQTAEEANRQAEAERLAAAASRSETEHGDDPPKVAIDTSECRHAIKSGLTTRGEIAATRAQATADSAAVFADLEAKFNLHRKALQDVERFLKMTESQRANYDRTYRLARAAAGAPVTEDMFGDPDPSLH